MLDEKIEKVIIIYTFVKVHFSLYWKSDFSIKNILDSVF